MAIQSVGRGRDTHLIKITLGYEQGTHKRLYFTETFKGTKKDARLREAELKIQYHRKKLVVPSAMTFRECFDLYLDEARLRLSPSTFHIYQRFIKRYLLPSLGDKRLNELVKDYFQLVYDSMTSRGLSPHTIYGLHCAARATITMALRKKLLSEDILKGVALPKIPKPKPEFLSYEEMQAFFDVASNCWYGNAFKFQFVTGQRNQELMALMWGDIDFHAATICIRRACCWVPSKFQGFKSTKTGEERIIELDDQTIDFLKRVKVAQEAHIQSRKKRGLPYGDERLVFCTPGGHVPTMDVVRRCFKKILKRIGITRRFRWYGARHTHATHLLDNEGSNPKMVANRMGHSVTMLFHTYGHEMPGQQRKALSKISSRVKL
jgi:integrase